jgi:two-component system NtrC family response regulator
VTKPRLLLVDDDEDIRVQMKWALAGDYEVTMAGDRTSAIAAFSAERPLVTLLDLGLPPAPNTPEEGLSTLAGLLVVDRQAKVIVVSGQGEKENALKAVGAGAWDFLTKPVDMDELALVLRRCVQVATLEREYRALQEQARPDAFEEMLGASPQMQAVFAFVRKVATTGAPVLVLGENGTGKEMVAKALHRRSRERGGPFVAINCGAIPEALLESELFGHEKGAFTGAHAARKGLIETAAGGTLFLDEIGELSSALQVKLLRFLQEKSFQRVGGRQEIQSDARVIAATNVNLQESVAAGTFREDLYFRLAVLVVTIPALRERGDDIALVAREFLRRYGSQHLRTGLTLAPDALRALNSHAWPGNIRELQNRIQRAVIMADGKRVTAKDLELADAGGHQAQTLREARDGVDRELVQGALRRHAGKITSAAEELGISRPTLYELMEKLGISRALETTESGAKTNLQSGEKQ